MMLLLKLPQALLSCIRRSPSCFSLLLQDPVLHLVQPPLPFGHGCDETANHRHIGPATPAMLLRLAYAFAQNLPQPQFSEVHQQLPAVSTLLVVLLCCFPAFQVLLIASLSMSCCFRTAMLTRSSCLCLLYCSIAIPMLLHAACFCLP